MNKLATLIIPMFLLLPLQGFADDKGKQDTMRSGTSTQQQLMTQEHLRDMSQVMTHMKTMMQDMTRLMEQERTMDRTRQQDMSQLMERISSTMHEMAQNVDKGQWSEQHQKKMQEQVKNMNVMLEKLQ